MAGVLRSYGPSWHAWWAHFVPGVLRLPENQIRSRCGAMRWRSASIVTRRGRRGDGFSIGDQTRPRPTPLGRCPPLRRPAVPATVETLNDPATRRQAQANPEAFLRRRGLDVPEDAKVAIREATGAAGTATPRTGGSRFRPNLGPSPASDGVRSPQPVAPLLCPTPHLVGQYAPPAEGLICPHYVDYRGRQVRTRPRGAGGDDGRGCEGLGASTRTTRRHIDRGYRGRPFDG